MLLNGRTGTQFSMRGALAATVSSIFILSSFAVADPGETKIEAVLSKPAGPGQPRLQYALCSRRSAASRGAGYDESGGVDNRS